MDKTVNSGNIDLFEKYIRQVKSLRMDRFIMDKLDLSIQHIFILHIISEHAGCNLKELSEHLGVTNPAASSTVQKLVKRGYIIRQENQNDRREKTHCLSQKGKEKLNELRKIITTVGRIFLNTLAPEAQHKFLSYFGRGVFAVIEYIDVWDNSGRENRISTP